MQLLGNVNMKRADNESLSREEKLLRQKRDIILKSLLTEDLNGDDEEKENLGIEEVNIDLISPIYFFRTILSSRQFYGNYIVSYWNKYKAIRCLILSIIVFYI